MRWCSEEFLRGLRELCTQEDIVLIFDEIYTGWGKTGTLFYFMRYPGLIPDVLTTSKSFGGGKSLASRRTSPGEPIFRKAYDNLTDALLQSTSTTYYGFGEEMRDRHRGDQHGDRGRLPRPGPGHRAVLAPALARMAKEHPDMVTDVRGAGALWGVFLDGGPRVLDLVAKLAPGGLARDPQFGTKLVTCAVINALYRDHDIFTYYTLNGQNPLVVGPPLVTGPAEVERFLDALDDDPRPGPPRLVDPVRRGRR